MAAFTFIIPTPTGAKQFDIDPGTSLYFVGANGGGKTRLAAKIEQDLGDAAHRISAHRALSLNPNVAKVSEADAVRGLRYGVSSSRFGLGNRVGSRWNSNAAVSLLNDFDFLIQAMFAEQANVALTTHQNARAGGNLPISATKFEKLNEIWNRLLPHRKLHFTGDNIQVSPGASPNRYSASEMSDGERAIFYMIGQTLTAKESSLVIFDEPELHIHRSITARLWDEIEAARPDCGMVIISHDLEFVASRNGKCFILQDYDPSNGWNIEEVPEDTGFSEETTTLILGSRKPILFVEGTDSSLDRAIYRACYPDWTIIPRNSCEEVIHAVATMRANASLTRIMRSGVIDSDGHRTDADLTRLQNKGISVLPVSEIENLLLLPNVIDAVLASEGFDASSVAQKRESILDEVFSNAAEPANLNNMALRYCRRKIDQILKKVDLSSATDVSSLSADYSSQTSSLDVAAIAATATIKIQTAISNRDITELLKWYDNKGLISIAAKTKSVKKANFEQWIVRVMRNDSAPLVTEAIRSHLPLILTS